MVKKHLKEDEFNSIKAVAKLVSIGQASKIFKRSYTVINMIYRAKDYEDYQRLVRQRYLDSPSYKARSSKANNVPVVEDDVPLPQVAEVKVAHVAKLTPGEQMPIKTIAFGFTLGKQRVIGLGEDNQIYTWSNQTWQIL